MNTDVLAYFQAKLQPGVPYNIMAQVGKPLRLIIDDEEVPESLVIEMLNWIHFYENQDGIIDSSAVTIIDDPSHLLH
jgi:hypothetical protein